MANLDRVPANEDGHQLPAEAVGVRRGVLSPPATDKPDKIKGDYQLLIEEHSTHFQQLKKMSKYTEEDAF